jgi:MoaA/NifB/PqqE/SkfB family radical SAM enzyme
VRLVQILPAWGRILRGYKPFLSLEITRECPLRCPDGYAYQPNHLGAAGPLRQLTDYKGEALVSGVLALIRHFKPMHISIVGGEPLVRYRELEICSRSLRTWALKYNSSRMPFDLSPGAAPAGLPLYGGESGGNSWSRSDDPVI